jgi:signal transduction histidine kinase
VNSKGIGLGLHISKMIVKEFKGEINFVSKYGVGSTFEFTFLLEKPGKN